MQLDFRIEEQTLTWVNREKTPVADSVKYLTAKFTFSDEWTGLNKTATFFTADGKAYSQILVDDGCEVPHEVIKAPLFKVSVAGGDLITTNIIIIGIIKSGYVKGETPKPPTPDVYTQILEKCDEAINTANDVKQRADNGEFDGEKGGKGDKGDKGDDYVLTDADKEEISDMASNKAKAYTDEQAGTLVKKGENWTDKSSTITKIILPSASYYFPDDENENSFYISADNGYMWIVHTKPGETLIFDILANKEDKLVTVIDESTGKEKAKVQDTWGIYANIENCTELGSDLGCIFYYYNETKEYIDESCSGAVNVAVEESKAYTDNKQGSLLKGKAQGAVIALDDISPVSKDIVIHMQSDDPDFTEWDIAGVDVYGKNLLYTTYEIGGIAGGSGGNYNNTKQLRTGYIPIREGNYYFSILDSDYKISGIFYYDKNNINLNMGTVIDKSKVIVPLANTVSCRLRIARVDGAEMTDTDLEKIKTAFQLEVGTSATEYEQPIKPVCYEAWELYENNYKVEGFYPNTTLMVEGDRTVMSVEYSRDLNKAFADLEQAIISLGGNI